MKKADYQGLNQHVAAWHNARISYGLEDLKDLFQLYNIPEEEHLNFLEVFLKDYEDQIHSEKGLI